MTKIRTVRVFSAAEVNGLLYGILVLLIAPFLMLGPGLAMMGSEKPSAGFGGVIALVAIAPIIYVLIGFVAGAVMAFIYNAISHSVGGIEVEFDLPPTPIATAPSSPFSAPPITASNEPPPPVRPDFE